MSNPKSTSSLETLRPAASPRRKTAPDLYTVLLAIALVAVLVTILFLWLYMRAFDYKTVPPATIMLGTMAVGRFSPRRR